MRLHEGLLPQTYVRRVPRGLVNVDEACVYINEVKPLNPDGTIQLNGLAETLPTQMTDSWIDNTSVGRWPQLIA